MRAGRKPKPTHLKLLEGKPGHRALNEDEPQPDALADPPPPPTHLSGEARAKWVEMIPRLMEHDMISEVDLDAFSAYCQAFGRWVGAESYVAKQGDVLIAPSGFPIQNPYLAIANKAMEQIAKFGVEFGLTPSSRSRVSSSSKKKKTNPFLELIRGSKQKTRA